MRQVKKGNPLYAGAISTTSYISSIGRCAMIGEAEHDKKIFLAHNFGEIKRDISRGSGEHLDAYLSVGRCLKFESIKKDLKNNYDSIYSINESFDHVYESMEESLVRNSCNLKKTS